MPTLSQDIKALWRGLSTNVLRIQHPHFAAANRRYNILQGGLKVAVNRYLTQLAWLWNRQPGWNGWMSTHCGKIVTLFLAYIQIGIDRRTYGYKIANASERIHVLNSKIGIYLKLQVKKECPFNRHWTSLFNFTTKMRRHIIKTKKIP